MVRGERAKRKGARSDAVWSGLFLGGRGSVVGLISGCCWGLLVVGEELADPGESALIGDWWGCCKVFLVRGLRRLLAGGRWGHLRCR